MKQATVSLGFVLVHVSRTLCMANVLRPIERIDAPRHEHWLWKRSLVELSEAEGIVGALN